DRRAADLVAARTWRRRRSGLRLHRPDDVLGVAVPRDAWRRLARGGLVWVALDERRDHEPPPSALTAARPSFTERPMLEARHVVKRFHGVTAVNDVSFEVRAGEIVGYLGPNGSGKSTTAKMLTGLVETSSGGVFLDGRDISHDPVSFRRRLGYVPEE